ncbi:hypothetical protein ACHWQZ_G008773 [Mnemiopsis leidyi]
MASVCGIKRCTGDVSPSTGKRHCDYKPCPEFSQAYQVESQPVDNEDPKQCIQGDEEQAMEVEVPLPPKSPPKTRVYTSMPGNNAHGPRYISAPYVANCSACSNGASGHINHGSYTIS